MITCSRDIEYTKIPQDQHFRCVIKQSVCILVNDLGSETESSTSLTSISSCDEVFMPSKMSPARVTPNEKKVKKRVLKKMPRFTKICDRKGVSV